MEFDHWPWFVPATRKMGLLAFVDRGLDLQSIDHGSPVLWCSTAILEPHYSSDRTVLLVQVRQGLDIIDRMVDLQSTRDIIGRVVDLQSTSGWSEILEPHYGSDGSAPCTRAAMAYRV